MAALWLCGTPQTITGVGSEVQKPVVIGGVITSTALTLIVLPILYLMLNRKRKESPITP